MHHRRASGLQVTGSADLALHGLRSAQGRLAAALLDVEAAIVARDVILRAPGPDRTSEATELARRATFVAAATLDEALDDLESRVTDLSAELDGDLLLPAALASAEARGTLPGLDGELEVVALVVELAGLAGIAAEPAARQAHAALACLRTTVWESDLEAGDLRTAVVGRLRRGRDAVAALAESDSGHPPSPAATRADLRRVAQVLGGALVVVAATSSRQWLGPTTTGALTLLGAIASAGNVPSATRG